MRTAIKFGVAVILAAASTLTLSTIAAHGEQSIGNSVGGTAKEAPSKGMNEVRHIDAKGQVNAVAWDLKDERVAVLSDFGSRVEILSSKNWSSKHSFSKDTNSYSGNSFAFLQGNQLLATTPQVDAADPAPLSVWDAQSGDFDGWFNDKEAAKHVDDRYIASALLFATTQDGTMVAAPNGPTSRNIFIYDGVSRKLIRTVSLGQSVRDTGYPTSVAFSPNKKQLAVGTNIGIVFLFDLDSGNLRRSFTAYPQGEFRCSAIVYSPDGKFIATGKDKTINISHSNLVSADVWREDSAAHVSSLEGITVPFGQNQETTTVSSIAWSGEMLAVADRISVRVWANPTTAPHLVLSRQMHFANSVSFSSGGILAVGGADGVFIFK